MDEFGLIRTFFKSLESNHAGNVVQSIGDDAAVIKPQPNSELVISTDTMVEGRHFLADWSADIIAYKALATNVSDMVAMGATAQGCVLALTLPSLNQNWLAKFANGLAQALSSFNVDLVGGDTTKGPLTITFTIYGMVPQGQALLRSNAKLGDLIYTTGTLGEGAYAVSQLSNNSADDLIFQKLFKPTPRIAYLPLLQQFASSAIDISDGLSSDLRHILNSSQLGANLIAAKIPVSNVIKQHCSEDSYLSWALHSGDEYEICFTVPADKQQALELFAERNHLNIHHIGHTTADVGILNLINNSGELSQITAGGFNHFQTKGGGNNESIST